MYRYLEKTYTDFYLWHIGTGAAPLPILDAADYGFAPVLLDGGILALTDCEAPNRRIVKVQPRTGREPLFTDVIPESDSSIQNWLVAKSRIYVSYIRGTKPEIRIFTRCGVPDGQLPIENDETMRLISAEPTSDEILLECESFTRPIAIYTHSQDQHGKTLWADRQISFDSAGYDHTQIWYPSKDGRRIPMFLVGRRDVLESGNHPAIMTSYGGYGIPMTPQFSILVAFLIERGCLFALPNIRGGSEFGAQWHHAAKRRNRQVAIDDFLSAAEWLVAVGRTTAAQLAIFGGSNSGLLVAAAMTQRPEHFPRCPMHRADAGHAALSPLRPCARLEG